MLPAIWGFFVNIAIIFLFVMWFWLLITIIGDLFRRSDVGGFAKVIWVIALVVVPLLAALAYILTQSKGMAERQQAQVAKARDDLREFVSLSPADELAKLEALKAKGSLSDAEFTKLRAKVIG